MKVPAGSAARRGPDLPAPRVPRADRVFDRTAPLPSQTPPVPPGDCLVAPGPGPPRSTATLRSPGRAAERTALRPRSVAPAPRHLAPDPAALHPGSGAPG